MRKKACERCVFKKLKCSDSKPCHNCLRAKVMCISRGIGGLGHRPLVPATRRLSHSKDAPAVLEETNIRDLSKSLLDQHSKRSCTHDYSAIPGNESQGSTGKYFVWNQEFHQPLPARPLLDVLINQYFLSVNWFMLVVEEDSFRVKVDTQISRADHISLSDRNFCLLALLVCGLGAHYLWTDPTTSLDRHSLRECKVNCLSELDNNFFAIISQPNLEAVQILILLGSFYLFNGRPNVGYGLLGSAIKIAQLIGLHRALPRMPINDHGRDSQIKVWWALEIFEKYAAVAFGRPCGIDDSDCEVPEIQDMRADEPLLCVSEESITILTYQRLKCQLYRIIGPFLGRRKESIESKSLPGVHNRFLDWYSAVPVSLRCEVNSHTWHERPEIIQMQALALQLAYDNLQMVLHRQAVFAGETSAITEEERKRSVDQLIESALRTSQATKYKIAGAICRSSHAAMHFGICLFTTGVILCALHLAGHVEARKLELLDGVDMILDFLTSFPGEQYGLTSQSCDVLTSLRSKCWQGFPERYAASEERDQSEVIKAILQSGAHPDYSSTDVQAATDELSVSNAQILDYASGSSLQGVAQSWLWVDQRVNPIAWSS